jgi:ElaA protein
MISMPNITVEWQCFEKLSTNALYEILRFRQSIFVVEQGSPYLDLDGLDQAAWHLLLRAEGALAGYLRMSPMPGPPPVVRIGRVAVASHLRWRGLGQSLMQDALRLHRQQYPEYDVALGAQAHLVPFYQGFGFATTSEPYDEFGVTHIDMTLRRNA